MPPTGKQLPKIPSVADKIEVLCVVKHNLEELQRGVGQNQLEIVHLLHHQHAWRQSATAYNCLAADT